MTTPGHHHPHFSPVVNVYWLCATSQDDSIHSGSVVLWFSLYILDFLSLLLILLLICYPSSCYCDFSSESLYCRKQGVGKYDCFPAVDEGSGPNAQCRWKPHGKM